MENPTSAEASGKQVARAGGIMVLSLFLSRILGLVRDMVMSGMFGAGGEVDAYRLAFLVPDLLFFLIAGGALSSAFIPVFSEYWHTDRKKEAWQIFSTVTSVMSLAVLAFIVAAEIFTEPLVKVLAKGRADESLELISLMTRIVLPAQLAFFVGGLMFGTLYARRVFAIPGLGPNIYNIGIIVGAVAISHFVQPGIVGMAWGALLGAVLGNLVIPFYAMRKLGSEFRFSLDTSHPGVRKVFALMLPVVLGLSLPGVYGLITQYFGSFYAEGANAKLGYANLLMQAPLGVFGQSLAIAVFPTLSQLYAEKRMDVYRSQVASTLRTTLYLSIPCSALLAVASGPIVGAVYQHGKFVRSDTVQVAELLSYYALGVWAWCMHPVLMRGFFAIQNSRTPILYGTSTTVVFLTLAFGLSTTSAGWLSLPMASSASAVFLAITMTLALRQKLGGLDLKGLGTTFFKSSLASVAFVAITIGLLLTPLRDFGSGSKLGAVLVLLAICIPGAAAYVWITQKLKMPEAEYVNRAMARIQKKVARS